MYDYQVLDVILDHNAKYACSDRTNKMGKEQKILQCRNSSKCQ